MKLYQEFFFKGLLNIRYTLRSEHVFLREITLIEESRQRPKNYGESEYIELQILSSAVLWIRTCLARVLRGWRLEHGLGSSCLGGSTLERMQVSFLLVWKTRDSGKLALKLQLPNKYTYWDCRLQINKNRNMS